MLVAFLTLWQFFFLSPELAVQSPLLHSALHSLGVWVNGLVAHIEEKKGPPPEYIPGCFAQVTATGPAITKYKALLETHNTPFP